MLVSTLDQKDNLFYSRLFQNCQILPSCLVINQITGDCPTELEKNENQPAIGSEIKWINLPGKGLSISRNAAIRDATEDIGVIADDDVIYLPGFEQRIISYHQQYPDYAIIIFKITTPDGYPFRNYPNDIKKVTKKIAGGISSIEMTFKLNPIREKNLFFDERFGLGARYPAGEEWIFVADALKKGLKVLFVPEYIVIHPRANSGVKYTKSRIMALGAAMYRVYGVQAYLRYFIFPKNVKKIHLEFYSFCSFYYFFLKGMIGCQFKKR